MNEIRCIKDVEFLGRTYAKKGEMIEVFYIGSQMSFNGTNGLMFSMSAPDAMQHFNKSDIERLLKSIL